MSINKAISDYDEITSLNDDDLLLVQRSDSYKKIKRQNLGGGIIRVEYTLTDTELEALNTTPIELIAAPGIGYAIKVIEAVAYRNGTAFTATDPQLKLRYSGGGANEAYETSATFLTAVANTRTESFIIDSQVILTNDSIQAFLDNDVTTATGTVKVSILYRIVTLA